MNLDHSKNLKKLPDLSNATNLKRLELNYCFQLVEIPSSFGKLQKLESLGLEFCVNLLIVPTHLNLASLKDFGIAGCSQLRKFPDIFKNITYLCITDKMLQDLPESIRLSSCLQSLFIFGDRIRIESFKLVASEQIEIDWMKDFLYKRAPNIEHLDVDIEKLPDWIKDLHGLQDLSIVDCPKLASLPELPASLEILHVLNCESLETLMSFPSQSEFKGLYFFNCLKLSQEARNEVIAQQASTTWLCGRNVPEELFHRVAGNSFTIPSGTKDELMVCIVISPKQGTKEESTDLLCRQSCNGFTIKETMLFKEIPADHLFIRVFTLPDKLVSDVLFEFSTTSKDLVVIECGFQILMDESSNSYGSISEQVYENDDNENLCDGNSEFDEPRVKRFRTWL